MKHLVLIVALTATPAFAQVTADTPNPTAVTPASAQVVADTPNPLAGKADAVDAGHALFGQMNCAGCHAYDLTGGMGPDLTDNSWQYGGKPGEIFHTIAEGTPRGMPAWKDKLTPDQIWQIVSYIQSKKQ